MAPFRSLWVCACTVHQARDLSNQILLGRMDPYCIVKLSNSKDSEFKTSEEQKQHNTQNQLAWVGEASQC